MGELLRRIREPATWLLLGVTALYVVLDLVRFVWDLGHEHTGLSAAASQSSTSVGLVWILLDLAMVLCCVLIGPPTRKVRPLSLVAALLVSIVAGYDLFLLIAGIIGQGSALGRVLEALGGFLEVLLKSAVAVVLWRVALVVGSRHTASGTPGPGADQPAWRPQDGAGATWDHAADAARGAGEGRRGDKPGPASGSGSSRQGRPRGAGPSLLALGEDLGAGDQRNGRTATPWATAAEQAAGITPPAPQDSSHEEDLWERPDDRGPRWTPLPPPER